MGRPPNCNCNCGNAGSGCNPAFTDAFTSVLPGYTFFQETFWPSNAPPLTLTTSAGTLSVTGNPNTEGLIEYYQKFNLQASGLRSVSVQVTLGAPSNNTADSILFIGLSGGSLVVELTASWGNFYCLEYPGTGFGANSFGTPTNGDTVKLDLEETATNVWSIVAWVNGSIAGSASGVSITTLSNPVAIGLVLETTEAGSPTDNWPSFTAPLTVSCVNQSQCLSTTYPAVWAVQGLPGVSLSTSRFPCNNCSLYQKSHALYYTGVNGSGQCVWTSADQIYCNALGTGYINQPMWQLLIYGSGPTSMVLQTAFAAGGLETQYAATLQNALGSNTLALSGPANIAGCTTFPSTITIAPA
ncbi:MAG TPA: hypothetical protein VGP76_13070 [Planctomycetaceae bacterium]|nr:hypothetical protein [Planctomycetaceae bacterium]